MKKGSKQPRYTSKQFISDCTQIHEGKYDYSKTVYTGSRNKITVICPVHGEFQQIAANHKAGIGCKLCYYDKVKNEQKFTKSSEQFINDAKNIHGNKYDYSKVNYINSHTYVTIICPEHGEFQQLPYNHLDGRGCPICGQINSQNNLISNAEKELRDYIKSIYSGEIVTSCRSLITPEEIDIYIPELKLAFEYNGLYWHSEDKGKYKSYHLDKTKKCAEYGIRLIHIFEDEWLFKKDIVKSKINNLLGLTSNKIFARKCKIVNVSDKQSKSFLNDNHIQGYVSSSIRIGLEYEDELVALMTFSKSRYNKNYNWELVRYTTKLNTSIIGGASKLLAYFRRNYTGNIISFADIRWSTGNLYDKLGFKFIKETGPNYFYFNPNKVIRESREKFQKHKLKDILPNFQPLKSEQENMKANNFYKIWDCGSKIYVL